MGSFTTVISCLNINRDFIGIELDKGYYDIAVSRMKNEEITKNVDVKSPVKKSLKESYGRRM